MMWLIAMAGSMGCMVVFYAGRKIWKTMRYTKPRLRGIDPVGEAEVFLAYGRTKVALLRAYSSDRNIRAYSTLAHDLQGDLQDKAIWHTIQRNGRDMDPHNPLFNA